MIWEDPQHDPDFDGKPEDAGETAICRYVGFLLKKNKKIVVLGSDADDKADTVRFIFTIPTKLVKEIKYFGEIPLGSNQSRE